MMFISIASQVHSSSRLCSTPPICMLVVRMVRRSLTGAKRVRGIVTPYRITATTCAALHKTGAQGTRCQRNQRQEKRAVSGRRQKPRNPPTNATLAQKGSKEVHHRRPFSSIPICPRPPQRVRKAAIPFARSRHRLPRRDRASCSARTQRLVVIAWVWQSDAVSTIHRGHRSEGRRRGCRCVSQRGRAGVSWSEGRQDLLYDHMPLAGCAVDAAERCDGVAAVIIVCQQKRHLRQRRVE